MEALGDITAEVDECLQRGIVLDTLGHGDQPQCVSQLDYGADDRAGGRIDAELGDERLVDLTPLKGRPRSRAMEE